LPEAAVLDLEYDLKTICRRNRDGSHMTQAQREQRLRLIARELHGLGYRNLRAASLKPKHVAALIADWQARGLSAGTIKNRMADLRWWAEKTGKPSVLASDNAHYGIAQRVFVTNDSKGRQLPADALTLVVDEHVRMSLRLQAAFGLRREESIKFSPSYADHGEHLALKASWCKGGRAREIPVRTPEQRALIRAAHQLAGKGSLIPPQRSYIQQRRVYERHSARAGLSKLHGLRHAYAQARYHELTGFPPPATGGPSSRELSDQQRALDHQARQQISRELGHEREQITAVYLGR
jgi:Phage integrase, N-terminal/Integrase